MGRGDACDMNVTLSARSRLMTALRSSGTAASLLRGTAGSLINRILANGLMFATQIVFARWLGLEGFGVYALALAWLGILVMVGRLGFDLATVRFVATYHGAGAWQLLRGFLCAGRITVLGASILTGGALAVGAVALKTTLGAPLTSALAVAGAALPLLALVQFEAAALRGLGRVILGDVPFSIGHPLMLLTGFLVAVTWIGAPVSASTALLAYFGATTVVLVWLRILMACNLPAPLFQTKSRFRWHEWLTTAPPMMLISGFGVVLNQSSTIVVGALSGPAAASVYGASSRIASILQIIVFSLIAVIGPLAAKLASANEFARLQRAIDVGVAAVFGAAFCAAIVLAVLGRWFLGLFGTGFVAGYEVLLILVAGQLCATVVAPAGILLNMTGHQNASARILAVAAITNLALCATLMWRYGVVGAAVATALTTAGLGGAMAIAIHRRLGLRSWVSPAALRLLILDGIDPGRANLQNETGPN